MPRSRSRSRRSRYRPPPRRYSRELRPSPRWSATLFVEGTIRLGNDGRRWKVKETYTGVRRWVPL